MNHLAGETSPYLLQHADQPVDWYPWGEEAFHRARELDRPLFISIGYSACHWCHVMAHESFDDEAIAAVLNAHFVPVKVDREEHPDVDAVYIEAVQAMTGGGGWPLNVFARPDGKPFFGGTYFPPRSRAQLPAFGAVLAAVRTAWEERRAELEGQADQLADAVAERLAPPSGTGRSRRPDDLLIEAVDRFAELFDPEEGGVGRAPKFPQAPMLELLLRAASAGVARAWPMVETTLGAMAAGGIYDHLGGGFCRYAVERTWTVPHFEKMLYDQAALGRLYGHAYLFSGDDRWRQVALETLRYVLRDLALASGGLASAEDADAEGEEGRFAVWTPEEMREALGEAGLSAATEAVLAWYGLDGPPNFDGRFILRRPKDGELERPPEIEAAREALFRRRDRRVHPGLDDKALTEWNAMAASCLAELGVALDAPDLLEGATRTGEFLLAHNRRGDGRWLRSFAKGRAGHLGVATDYAWLVDCFTRLAEASGSARWLAEARRVADDLVALFGADDGGFYLTGSDASGLPIRPRDGFDGVLPAAGSIAASALARLGALVGDQAMLERAERTVAASAAALERAPLACAHLLGAALQLEAGALEIVVTGDRRDLLGRATHRFLPDAVYAWGEPTDSPLWEARADDLAYICRGGVCLAPVGDAQGFDRALDEALARR